MEIDRICSAEIVDRALDDAAGLVFAAMDRAVTLRADLERIVDAGDRAAGTVRVDRDHGTVTIDAGAWEAYRTATIGAGLREGIGRDAGGAGARAYLDARQVVEGIEGEVPGT